jgi:hypothetical protein
MPNHCFSHHIIWQMFWAVAHRRTNNFVRRYTMLVIGFQGRTSIRWHSKPTPRIRCFGIS